jgi:hypothetical protein
MFWTRKPPTPPNDLSRYERSRVIVVDKAGTDYAGVLEVVLSESIVLRATERKVATVDRPAVPLDGEIILLLANVDFIQRLG